MKKLTSNGFTLIELLAVITIMGILMLVAIPAVSRTIENTRRDQFLDTAKQYVNAVKILWISDGIHCGGIVSSAVDAGKYFFPFDSSNPELLDSGGKSSWGSRNVKGYVWINVVGDGVNRKITYSVSMRDYASNTENSGTGTKKNNGIAYNEKDYLTLKRSDVLVDGVQLYCSEKSADDTDLCYSNDGAKPYGGLTHVASQCYLVN